jgi:hypothetical protein
MQSDAVFDAGAVPEQDVEDGNVAVARSMIQG